LKVIVLGSGKIGSIIAEDFSKTGAEISIGDIDIKKAKKLSEKIGADSIKFDTSNFQKMVKQLSKYDLVLGALPGDYGFPALKATVEAGKNIVDVSYTPQDPGILDPPAKEAGVTIIPDCGVAPGLSNLLVGYSASRLDRVKEAKIMVGGIPETPVPPLGYTITWSADGLIDEYIRDVSIIKNHKLVQVPALSGLETIQFPGVGKLEAFYTDGLRSLTKSLPDVENMYEKTLRYPGHVNKIKIIRELGFFSEDPIQVQGYTLSPKLIAARILEKSLTRPEIGDLVAMMIEVTGEKNGVSKGYRQSVLEYTDHKLGISAMARTTAYTASIVARALAEGRIDGKGVVTMEDLGKNSNFVDLTFDELGKRDIQITETEI
jgi:saccharopine dehydrogenase-like NADP-dependent oxidoreductase